MVLSGLFPQYMVLSGFEPSVCTILTYIVGKIDLQMKMEIEVESQVGCVVVNQS